MSQQGSPETTSTAKKILLFIVGACVAQLIIAICLFIVGGVANTKLCDPATPAANGPDMTDPATADQNVSICIAAVNALRYSYFGVGALYIIMTIASFAVSWV
ncbi:hypothetical protein BJ742DRAFT_741325 [Cladochytrium replicatum]|nr:hypothetical protein BJ742DRAFT_741325 [Cladochytrium replicatum]